MSAEQINIAATISVIVLGSILRGFIGPFFFGRPCESNLTAYVITGVLLGVILWGIWS